ncbi:hypothetical protein H6G96_26125 [Nostoc sp. FACHB-892]|uniref:hypothetical protein n=1 Tax=Nostoc sp. FACHB-892 TaxID=2692843 RepID=UPI001688D027|nr:hypothetical protein [Nostoc sp. FACHB-892]MBD2729699.1 hypothetical protein [Nostoc sp. FACHB-892]
MICSMQDYLKIISPHLHPDLVSPEALSYIQSLAQILPVSSLAGFECRLGANQSRVDFQTHLALEQNLPEQFLTHPTWQSLQEFYREWALPKSVLHQVVEGIGLEFDIDGCLDGVPIPCIFLALKPIAAGDSDRLIETGSSLIKHRISIQLQSNLRLCADALPPGAFLSHFGAMLSRSSEEAIRVVVKGLTPEQLIDYLTQIGWTDPTNTFSTLVPTLSEFVDYILLSFDVGKRVYPRISWEGFLKKLPQDQPHWQQFLDYLVAQELCAPSKRDALLAWNGFSQPSSAPEFWPRNISLGDRLLGSRAISLFSRWINHIKVVYQPGYPLEAKAYLGFAHGWFDASLFTHKEITKGAR